MTPTDNGNDNIMNDARLCVSTFLSSHSFLTSLVFYDKHTKFNDST